MCVKILLEHPGVATHSIHWVKARKLFFKPVLPLVLEDSRTSPHHTTTAIHTYSIHTKHNPTL